jgi:hypothetical protein
LCHRRGARFVSLTKTLRNLPSPRNRQEKPLPNPYVRRLLIATGVNQDTASQEAQNGCQRAIAAVDEPGPGFPSAILRKRRAVECQALSDRAGGLASRTPEAQPTRKSLSDSLFQSFGRPFLLSLFQNT